MAQVIEYKNFLSYIRTKARKDLCVLIVRLQGLLELEELLGLTLVNEVLESALSRSIAGLRPVDVITKLDRYHLGVMLPNIENAQFAFLAGHKLRRLLAVPYHLSDHRLHLRPCIGIATFLSEEEQIEHMFCRAMTALREAQGHYDGICLSDLNHTGTISPEYRAMTDLAEAIESNDLQIYLQPQYNYASDTITSAEALLRWDHTEFGYINTEKLINLVEKTDLIGHLTAWVVTTSLRHCASARKAGISMGIHINLSAANLSEPDLVDLILHQLDVWDVPIEDLVIELTETAAVQERRFARKQLLELKRHGIQLSMDDFGSGYANLDRLISMPLDELKIDKVFIQALGQNDMVSEIVAGIIDTAHKMGLKVIAEGVEDQETFDILRELGCDFAQGYFVGPPYQIDDFIHTFSSKNTRSKKIPF